MSMPSDATSESVTLPETPATGRAWKKRLLWIISGLVVLALAGGGAFWYRQKRNQPLPSLLLVRQNLQEKIDVSGAVLSEHDVVLKASLSAQVLGRLVAENERVEAGTPLLKLDNATYQLQLQQARTNASASLNQADTESVSATKALNDMLRRKQLNLVNLRNQVQKAHENLRYQEDEYLRQIRLNQEGVSPDQRLEQQKQALEQARIELKSVKDNLASAEQDQTEITTARNRLQQARTSRENALKQGLATVQLAQDTLSKNAITAPFNGSIARWQVNRGDYVTPGTPLARFLDTRDLRLVLNINELDLPKVRIGAAVEITFDAYPETPYPGRVDWISESSITDSDNVQVFPVKIRFENPNGKIRPGMSADAQIAAAERKNILAVPISQIRKKEGRYFVDVLENNQAREKEVKLGIATLEQVEILSGLKAGQRLVMEATPAPSPSGRQ
jgi:HlyD family secretion protein